MWITTVTVNLISMDSDLAFVFDTDFNTKKQELQNLDGAGFSLPEFQPFETITDIDVDSFIVKRSWNTEQNARAFSDLVTDAFGSHAEVTVEEQV